MRAKLIARYLFVLVFLLSLIGCDAIPTLQRDPLFDYQLYQSIVALVSLLLAMVTGGGIAVILDDLPVWKEWDAPKIKYWLVVIITGFVGLGLVMVQSIVTPELIGLIPAPLVTVIYWFVLFVTSQLSHGVDR